MDEKQVVEVGSKKTLSSSRNASFQKKEVYEGPAGGNEAICGIMRRCCNPELSNWSKPKISNFV